MMIKKKTMSLFLTLALVVTTVFAVPTVTYAEDSNNQKIERVDVTIKAPACGTWVSLKSNDSNVVNDNSQDPAPVISIPKDAPYKLDTDGLNGKWIVDRGYMIDYYWSVTDGAMVGGKAYEALICLKPKDGYEFSFDIFNAYVNGKYYGRYVISKYELKISPEIVAVHDWKAATKTKPKTCKACGATEGNPIGSTEEKSIGKKVANPLKIKSKTTTVKYSKLKKKNQTLAAGKVISFTKKGKGKVTYAKISGNKKITINKNTGKVTIKKKLKKGTYKVKVKVRAEGNSKYKPVTRTVTFKIKVK